MELFRAEAVQEPLAARMRPRTLEEFAGQDHIVGPGRLLRRAIQADQLSSLIFYGPPGTGKTTLARIIANNTKSRFVALNAVLSGVKDVREAVKSAIEARDTQGRRTLLFVDEVHRWNKAQQDALLPWVENGTVVLIGATTENPYFEVIPALVSRSRVFQLQNLTEKDLKLVLESALSDKNRGYGQWTVSFEKGALEHLLRISSGDARSLLNALQLAVETTPPVFPPPPGESICISLKAAEESIQRQALLYDKEGDYHFDTISAFIKSLRGSDPDAALYWLALMIRGGEDPRFILRRMLISASEDIGLADPHALTITAAAATAFDRVGLPEGQFHLAQAAIYLASCPKSNSTLGYFDALKVLEEEQAPQVPGHLKDSSRDSKSFGHGEGYRYPHAWRDHWVAQQYLPEALKGRFFYRPSKQGYEGSIRKDVLRRREAQLTAMLEEDMPPGEIFTYSPGDKGRETWTRRTEKGLEPLMLRTREILFNQLKLMRHERVLVMADNTGVLIWETHRRVPEGGATLLCRDLKSLNAFSSLAEGLPQTERPRIIKGDLRHPSTFEELKQGGLRYEIFIGRHFLTRETSHEHRLSLLSKARQLSAPGGRLCLMESSPKGGSILAEFIPAGLLEETSFKAFKQAEDTFLNNLEQGLKPSNLLSMAVEAGWMAPSLQNFTVEEKRFLSPELLKGWFRARNPGGYGKQMALLLGAEVWEALCETLLIGLGGRQVPWITALSILKAQCP